jgi:hypothetical protein
MLDCCGGIAVCPGSRLIGGPLSFSLAVGQTAIVPHTRPAYFALDWGIGGSCKTPSLLGNCEIAVPNVERCWRFRWVIQDHVMFPGGEVFSTTCVYNTAIEAPGPCCLGCPEGQPTTIKGFFLPGPAAGSTFELFIGYAFAFYDYFPDPFPDPPPDPPPTPPLLGFTLQQFEVIPP